MTVLAIIQARINSERLPRKVLADIGGKPMLQHVVDRARECKRIHSVVVAVPESDYLEIGSAIVGVPVKTWRGKPDDVLGRIETVATTTSVRPDCIVRLTGDCPFLDPEYVDAQIAQWERLGGICVPDGWHEGLGGEVFSYAALLDAAKHSTATERYDNEHVTPYIRRRYHCHECGRNTPSIYVQPSPKHSIDTTAELHSARRRFYAEHHAEIAERELEVGTSG